MFCQHAKSGCILRLHNFILTCRQKKQDLHVSQHVVIRHVEDIARRTLKLYSAMPASTVLVSALVTSDNKHSDESPAEAVA